MKSTLKYKLIIGILVICSLQTSLLGLTDTEIKEEIKVGRTMAASIIGIYKTVKNKDLQKYVNLVGNSVAHFNGRKELSYYFFILDSPQKNAFACPGGYILITKGLIDSLENEAQLAGVLAHEIAHVNLRHIYKTIQVKQESSTEVMVNNFLRARNSAVSVLFNQLSKAGLEVLLKKGLQHEDEYEADIAAMLYLKNVGYTNTNYIKILKNLNKTKGGISLTHPSFDNRIKALMGFVDNDKSLKQLTSRFLKYIK